MSQGVLKFNLPEEQVEWDIACHAMDWALTSWDVDQKLREWIKYGHEFKTPEETLEATRKMLHDILQERGLTLETII